MRATILMEGFSFRTAVWESNRTRGQGSWAQFIRSSKAPELPVVLLEDFAALLGLVFVLLGVGPTLLTHDGIWDAIGTGLIGLLLVSVAIVLAIEMTSLLLGEVPHPLPTWRRSWRRSPAHLGIDRVIHQRILHVGPEESWSRRRWQWRPGPRSTTSLMPSTTRRPGVVRPSLIRTC